MDSHFKKLRKMNVLITSANWKAALTVVRSMARNGANVSLISDDLREPALYSKYCRNIIISPNEKNREEYLEFLLKTLKSQNYELFIPVSEPAILYSAEYKDEISKYTKFVLPPLESIKITCNKLETYKFAYANSIPIPKTFFPTSLEEVQKIAASLIYPCIVKNRVGVAGHGNKIIFSKNDLIILYQRKTDKNAWPVIQEIVNGVVYSFAGFCSNGILLDYFMCEKTRQLPESGGLTVYGKSAYNSKVLEVAMKTLKSLSWSGAINYDIILTKENECFLIDINPRFPGNLQFSYMMGVDLPSLYLTAFGDKKRINGKDLFLPTYRLGIDYRAVFMEELKSCKQNPRYLVDFFINFFMPNIHHDYSLEDPKLIYWQLRKALGLIFK